ncbi:MAG: GDSL-type esterase/lipase family protein [Gemmatimonadota bacterium]
MRLLRLLASSALSALVGLGLAEAALQIVDHPPRSRGDHSLFFEHDSLLGWRNKPNVRGELGEEEYRVELAFNSRGLRGPLRSYAKPAGTYRVLMLGDSFLEGYTVQERELVTTGLEDLLDAAQGACRVEVIGLGTSGYSTDQELLWLESEGLRYDPDLVVLMFYANDVWYNAQPSLTGPKPLFVVRGDTLVLTNVPVPQPNAEQRGEAGLGEEATRAVGVRSWLREESKLYALVRLALRNHPRVYALAIRAGLAEGGGEIALDATGEMAVPAEFLVFLTRKPPEVHEAWRTTDALLERMRRSATRAGAGILGFYISPPWSVDEQESAVRPQSGIFAADLDARGVAKRFLEACARASMPCIDATARFSQAAHALRQENRRLYFRYDRHWTAEGHRLAARILADRVLESGLSCRTGARAQPRRLQKIV